MRLLIKNRRKFPKCIRHFQEVKGICIGECVDKRDSISPNIAHAHSDSLDSYHGWICIQYKYRLKEKYTLLHEVAHLIANKLARVPTHGKEWRAVVKRIGGTYKPYLTFTKSLVYLNYAHSDPKRK